MTDATGDPAGPAPRAVVADLPEPVWPGLLEMVRTALQQTSHEPRRLSPFVGWHPDKFDRPEVRRAVTQVLAADARFRADLRDVVTDHHPDLAAGAERGEGYPSTPDAPGAVAAALVAWDRWDTLATFSARVAAEQVRGSAPVAAERSAGPPADGPTGPSSQGRSFDAQAERSRLDGRIRELERALRHRDRRLDALRADLERVRREREAAVVRRDRAERELQDVKTRQRDRLTRLRRRYHDARDRAAAAEERVADLAEELTHLLGRLTGRDDDGAEVDDGDVPGPGVTLDGPGEADAALSPSDGAGTTPLPRGVRPAVPGRPCQLPPGVLAGTAEAARALLQVDQLELLIDGYNVSKDLRGRPSASLPDQRLWLLRTVAGATARLPVRPTLVFDAAEAVTGPSPSARGVRVIFTDPGELADDRIAAYVAAMGDDVPVCVVTSDREVRERCASQAANTVASGIFLRAIGASS